MQEVSSEATTQLEDHFITLPDGVTVHYQEAGSPEALPVVLTHGFLGSFRDWRYTIEPLASLGAARNQPLRVIALDWAGFGLSSKPDTTYSLTYYAGFLKRFFDALGLKRVYLVGHSMGGKHNLAFALLHPEYVEKLALVSTDGFVEDPKWIKNTDKAYFELFSHFTTSLLSRKWFLKFTLKTIFYDKKFFPSEEELKAAAQEFRDPQYKIALLAQNRYYSLRSLTLTGFRQRLGELKVPVQLYWGLQDRLLTIENGYRAQQEIPGAQLYVFDKCGHMPQIEHAEEFNQKLLEFLSGS
ncbi:MAG TPA: alpha/beta hydrolase [Chloroflexia bacterium]|nr:alpha/beta hydrolase [Chloroflexia bacterium]